METRIVKNNHSTSNRALRTWMMLVLCLLYPCLTGGCPDLRNGAVDAVDAAVRGLLFGDLEPRVAVVTAGEGLANAGLDFLFDFLRADTSVR